MTVQLYARDVGAGTPLVLLHAFPLSSAMWLAQREGLANRFRIITPDLRGFGGSVLGDDEPSVDAMADDVARLFRSLGVRRAVVAGLSMGGYVAMALCRRHPDLVLGLVLAATRATADAEPVRENRLRQAERLDREGGTQVLVEEVLPGLVGPTTYRQRALIYGRVRGLVQATPPHGLIRISVLNALTTYPVERSCRSCSVLKRPTYWPRNRLPSTSTSRPSSSSAMRAMTSSMPSGLNMRRPGSAHLFW
jgi:pimeloyl-ACP methyl ester carboxylesterase